MNFITQNQLDRLNLTRFTDGDFSGWASAGDDTPRTTLIAKSNGLLFSAHPRGLLGFAFWTDKAGAPRPLREVNGRFELVQIA